MFSSELQYISTTTKLFHLERFAIYGILWKETTEQMNTIYIEMEAICIEQLKDCLTKPFTSDKQHSDLDFSYGLIAW